MKIIKSGPFRVRLSTEKKLLTVIPTGLSLHEAPAKNTVYGTLVSPNTYRYTHEFSNEILST